MKKLFPLMPAILFAAALIFFGIQKFGAENFIFERLAERSGIALFEPGIRILTGILEVLAGVMILLPRVRLPGLLLGLGIVGGAIVFHLSPWLGILVPAGAGAPETPALFFTALGLLTIGIIATILRLKS